MEGTVDDKQTNDPGTTMTSRRVREEAVYHRMQLGFGEQQGASSAVAPPALALVTSLPQSRTIMGLSEDHHDTSIDRDSTRDSHDLPWPKRDTFPAHVACALASVTAMFQDRIRNVTVAFSSLSVVHDSIDDKRETPRHPPC